MGIGPSRDWRRRVELQLLDRIGALIFGISVFTNLGLNGVLVPRFGVAGAALAVGGSLVLTNLALVVLVHRQLGRP